MGLNAAQIELISQFIDIYLELNTQEEAIFERQLATIEPLQEEEIMEIVTSWERRASQREAVKMIVRLLNRRVGGLTAQLQERIQQLSTPQLEDLGEALLDFNAIADLKNWLITHEN